MYNFQIWDSDSQGAWKLTGSWKAHHGSIWKVTWAHPEFGQVIATCSFDRTAAVWEEVGKTLNFRYNSLSFILRLFGATMQSIPENYLYNLLKDLGLPRGAIID
jgi:WD40 repeat protein